MFESQDPTACTRLRLVAAPTAARLTSHLSYCHDPNGNEDASKAFRNCILRIEKLTDHIKSTVVCKRVCVFPEALTTGQLSCRKVSCSIFGLLILILEFSSVDCDLKIVVCLLLGLLPYLESG